MTQFMAADDDPVTGAVVGIDLGLRTGVAVFGPDSVGQVRLRRYSSTHLPSRAALRRAASAILADVGALSVVALEGDRALAAIWARSARHVAAEAIIVTPEQWRAALLWPRERTPSAVAKAAARSRAMDVVSWSRNGGGPDAPPAVKGRLNTDTADAIMIGLWAVLDRGLVDRADLPFPTPNP